MMEVFIISLDSHPAGDYLVKALRMRGLSTDEEQVGRASSLRAAHALLPIGVSALRRSRRVYAGRGRPLLEVWA